MGYESGEPPLSCRKTVIGRCHMQALVGHRLAVEQEVDRTAVGDDQTDPLGQSFASAEYDRDVAAL